MTLGEKITYLREKIPLYTQKQFAIDLKLTCPTITRYERNERIPNLDILVKISNIFKITLDDLIKDTEFSTEIHSTRLTQLYFKVNRLLDEDFDKLNHYMDYLIHTNINKYIEDLNK